MRIDISLNDRRNRASEGWGRSLPLLFEAERYHSSSDFMLHWISIHFIGSCPLPLNFFIETNTHSILMEDTVDKPIEDLI